MKINLSSPSALLVDFLITRLSTYYSPFKFKKIKKPVIRSTNEKKTC